MPPLTNGRDTRSQEIFFAAPYPVKANAIIQDGGLVALSLGFAVPAADAVGAVIVGVADWRVDNTGGANGDKLCRVRRGVFHLDQSGMAQADMGGKAFVVDDHTVSKTAGTNSTSAGELLYLDPDGGVWVKVGP